MFGVLRLALASLVAISHVGIGIWPGFATAAVIGFFILSGYVTAALLHEARAASLPAWRFYADRALRIYPLYWVALACATVLSLGLGYVTQDTVGPVTAFALASSILALPLSWYFVVPDLAAWTPLPVAWSLGLELQFYLLAPLFLVCERRRRVALASLFLWALSILVSDPVVVGKHLILAIGWVFCLGAMIHDARTGRMGWRDAGLLGLGGVLLGLLDPGTEDGRETVVAVALGVLVVGPTVAILSRQRSGWRDALAGAVSYGVFLFHIPVMLVAAPVWPSHDPIFFALGATAISAVVALAAHLAVERPVLAWRRRIGRAAAQRWGAPCLGRVALRGTDPGHDAPQAP